MATMKKKAAPKPASRSTAIALTARGHDALVSDARRATDAELAANLRASVKNYNRDLAAAVKAGLVITAQHLPADGSPLQLDDPVTFAEPQQVILTAIDRKHI